MSIASAIAATSPNLWWKLDEASGAVANNSGSLANNGTFTGDYQRGVAGPETGTLATRFYLNCRVLSLAMDLNTFHDLSIGFWVATQAAEVSVAARNMAGIGDPTSPATRGPRIYENHSTQQIPIYATQWPISDTAQRTAPIDYRNWHWVCATYGSAIGIRLYIDTGAPSIVGNPFGATLNLADPFWLIAETPFVMAHACVWLRTLASSEITAIANEQSTMPWEYPINTPYPSASGGGGGGLTGDQAAQLARIDDNTDATSALQTGVNTLLSNWAGYTGVTLPSLQDTLDAISGQVTGVQDTLNGWVTGLWTDVQNAIQNVLDNVQATIPGPAGDVLTGIGHLFSPTSMDQIGLYDVLGGPTCSNIDLDLSHRSYWGLQLTITERPMHFWPSTPDNDWTIADLAVISIVVSGNLLARIPVHTSTWSLNGLPGGFPFKVADVGIPILPGGYHLKVEWAQGVCGKLELQYLPVVGPPGFPHFP